MPAGNDLLTSISWQPVPGAQKAAIYPLIRKIDISSSNSYLIAMPDVILLVDPGGLSEQVDQLARVIGECRAEKDRPVFVFLTHAHIDHFLGVQLNPVFAFPETVVFAAHQSGGCALESGDTKITQAEILQQPLFPMKIGFHLFTELRAEIPGVPVTLCFPNGAQITIIRDCPTNNPTGLPWERIQFGSDSFLDVYHTPGHSPDSICLRIGDILLTGDLLVAANPGVAGVTGWSREALIHSLTGVEQLVAVGGIQLFCPGHGRVIPAQDALKILSSVRADALALTNIIELNYERAASIAVFAEDCMEQVNELFTIMAGRISYVAYILDEIDESDLAEQISTFIRGDTIDELVESFRNFSEEYYRGQQVPVQLMLKAGQVITKLERTFDQYELATIIDPTLVRRAARLLSDYITMFRGYTLPREISNYNLIPLIEAVVTGLSVPSYSDGDVLSSSNDEAGFSRILLANIGSRPLLEEVECTVVTEGTSVQAFIDRDHFVDLLIYILEDLVGTGVGRIEIHIQNKERNSIVTINGILPSLVTSHKRRTWRFLKALSERVGGILTIHDHEGIRRFEFTAKINSLSRSLSKNSNSASNHKNSEIR